MKNLLSLVALFASSFCIAESQVSFDGYVEVEPDVSLYAKMYSGASDQPIFVLLNGLTQDSEHWATTIPYLRARGATILTLDLALQGRSMVKRLREKFSPIRPIVEPLIVTSPWLQEPVFPMVDVAVQARYVSEIMMKLGIKKKVILVGLSYGGGLDLQMAADFPDQIDFGVMIAPYAFPLPDQDKMIRDLVAQTKATNPFYRYVDDDRIYDVILRGLVVSTYPSIEPEIMKWSPPYQAIAAGELVRGIRHLSYPKLLSKINIPLHLVIAGKDSYIPKDALEQFWAAVPKSIKGSVLEVQGVEHKVNESVGPYLAAWLWELAIKKDDLTNPGRFLGVPSKGIAIEIGGSRTIVLEPTVPCETWLSSEFMPASVNIARDRIKRGPRGWLQKVMGHFKP
jgi:pimeloyl-ACP methyl ester carboxylesterase